MLLPVSSGPEVLGWYEGMGEDRDWSLLGWPQWELVPGQAAASQGIPNPMSLVRYWDSPPPLPHHQHHTEKQKLLVSMAKD